MQNDKEIVYCNRVRIGNWYEAATLEEYELNKFLQQMKKGDLMLARFRTMTEILNQPTTLTQTTGPITFGSKITLLAPYVPAACSDTDGKGETGVLLGGRISSNQITYTQELKDGFTVVAVPNKAPVERSTFIITSSDYCDRTGEQLKYNQELLLMLSLTPKSKPLYLRYDPEAIPGLCGNFPLYLSENPVSNTRWRILPEQKPSITRFEQEGNSVTINTDIIINHCATNLNLGVNTNSWFMGFYGPICCPLMKTCLDVYGRELPNNIWQIYVPFMENNKPGE